MVTRKLILILSATLLMFAMPSGSAAPPKLIFPGGLSWETIFANGFRPKHIPGLQTDRAECVDQELIFKIDDRPDFPLDKGRLMFELQSDDSIRVIEHVSRVPISMDEADKRLKAFHSLFERELLRTGSVPPLMDKARGSVMALSDYYATAEANGYTIHYGFTGSFQPGKPLLPVFMIALRHNMKAVPLPIRRKTVEPPEGFEWYSLDPKVSTPDPGAAPDKQKPSGPGKENPDPER